MSQGASSGANALSQTSKAITELKGVGPALALTLSKLNLHTIQDLLFHLPLRYLDRTRVVPIGDLQLNTSVVIEGVVTSHHIAMGRRRSLLVTLEDETGRVHLRFYHFNAQQQQQFAKGTRLRCCGDPRLGATGLEFYHPEYTVLYEGKAPPVASERLTPVYGLTEGLSQARMRKLAEAAVEHMAGHPPAELLPAEFNTRFKVDSLSDALAYVHFPPADAPIDLLQEGRHPCQLRLAFEELLAHHLALQQVRELGRREQAPNLKRDSALADQLLAKLGFALTGAQQRVANEIQADLDQAHPMLRLVQGDVGSGKTAVAAMAAISALANHHQCAIVAPTEILAEQHKHNFERWLAPLGFEVSLLIGRLTPKQKKQTLEDIDSGKAQVIVGTHALFEDRVEFDQLGLVIIDEQHRFGVHQRLSLRDKTKGKYKPHQLVMTATPIPRTLAMSVYADLDVSVIDELPPGRTPITTVLIKQTRRNEVIERVRAACKNGAQAYWVCTLVEDSETLAATAAEESFETLQAALPELDIGLVHGRLKGKEKEAVMSRFKQGDCQLLVATTVIEVGVDVPNASLMIIENPERLGLAQLHQLRGRVGRGSAESYCVLLYGDPLSKIAKQRLNVLRSTQDGFVIAEEDLKIRGPGELLGTQQTGDMRFRLADLLRDAHLLPHIHSAANQIRQQNPAIATRLIDRWFFDHLRYTKG